MLLNDTLTVRVHDVRKPVLCLARDWCNKCSVVHEIACMQCTVSVCESRRDAVRLPANLDETCILDEIISSEEN